MRKKRRPNLFRPSWHHRYIKVDVPAVGGVVTSYSQLFIEIPALQQLQVVMYTRQLLGEHCPSWKLWPSDTPYRTLRQVLQKCWTVPVNISDIPGRFVVACFSQVRDLLIDYGCRAGTPKVIYCPLPSRVMQPYPG